MKTLQIISSYKRNVSLKKAQTPSFFFCHTQTHIWWDGFNKAHIPSTSANQVCVTNIKSSLYEEMKILITSDLLHRDPILNLT